ncbi:GAF domain-containing protein [Caballeronia arvi]|uniref:GAF domain-containing protein n=1 Tax=Caballeronia arvi TaxID=1777135 RepID=UPI001F22FF90|nr:GAF domain-containing protein [Caballeronia arvi]
MEALSEYGLSGQSLPSLEPVASIAARMFNMPVAAVNMIGNDHVFLAASVGLDLEETETGRDVSFCAHAIAESTVMVVPDATRDARFLDNPLVTGPAQVRFYAGVPLMSPDGHALGALCVIDHRAHHDFSAEDGERLQELAKMAADRLELRRIEIRAQATSDPSTGPADGVSVAVVRFDDHRRVIAWNAVAAAIFGYGPAEASGLMVDILVVERDRAALASLISGAASAQAPAGTVSAKLNGVRKNGTKIPLGFSLKRVRTNVVSIFEAHLTDLTALQREQEEIHRLANTDVLTGLPNRACLYRQTEHVLGSSGSAAVIVMDVYRFKDVNAELGHILADRILLEVARRLEKNRQAERHGRAYWGRRVCHSAA